MTDPRLLECAKAIAEAHASAPDGMVFSQYMQRMATACILKWLEQEPSNQMYRASEMELRSQLVEGSSWLGGDCYRVMTAAKELSDP